MKSKGTNRELHEHLREALKVARGIRSGRLEYQPEDLGLFLCALEEYAELLMPKVEYEVG